jgi:hypothetical protein
VTRYEKLIEHGNDTVRESNRKPVKLERPAKIITSFLDFIAGFKFIGLIPKKMPAGTLYARSAAK